MGCGASAQPQAEQDFIPYESDYRDLPDIPGLVPLPHYTIHISKMYTFQRGLGKVGTTSTVRRAKHTSGATRAVKCILKTEVEPTMREALILSALDHSNLLKAFETFEDKRIYYIVTENLTGGELAENVGALTHQDAATVLRQVSRGVSFMHSQRVCHRDIRPANIVLETPRPLAEAVIKIIDFGSACFFTPGQKLRGNVGTPYYSSPEMAKGPYAELCDVWSCGVLLFVLLRGLDPQQMEGLKMTTFEFSQEDMAAWTRPCRACLYKLLSPEESRVSAADMRDDKWISNQAVQDADAMVDSFTFGRISSYCRYSPLKRRCVQILAQRLNIPQIEKLKNIFRSLDKDGDGHLSTEELRTALQKAGLDACPETLDTLISEMDLDGNSRVQFSEFLAAAMDRKILEDENVLVQAFQVFDTDGSGGITKPELASLLRGSDVPEYLCEDKFQNMVNELDQDQDGELSLTEFLEMFAKVKKK